MRRYFPMNDWRPMERPDFAQLFLPLASLTPEDFAPVILAAGVVATLVALFLIYRVALRIVAAHRFGVRIPFSVRVLRERRDTFPGRLSLAYPHWARSKADGTRDRRTNNYKVIRPNSAIMVGRWRLLGNKPIVVYRLACALRDAGTEIEPCSEEMEKRIALSRRYESQRSARSVDELVARFADRPTDFEQFCAALYRALGYNAIVTPPRNDGGYDIKLINPQTMETYIVECKCYARGHSIGRPLIQKLCGANDVVRANGMLFITTSGYSAAAREYAAQVGVALVDGPSLLSLCTRAWGTGEAKAITERETRLTDGEIRARFPPDLGRG